MTKMREQLTYEDPPNWFQRCRVASIPEDIQQYETTLYLGAYIRVRSGHSMRKCRDNYRLKQLSFKTGEQLKEFIEMYRKVFILQMLSMASCSFGQLYKINVFNDFSSLRGAPSSMEQPLLWITSFWIWKRIIIMNINLKSKWCKLFFIWELIKYLR